MTRPLPSIVEDELLRYGYGLSPERQGITKASPAQGRGLTHQQSAGVNPHARRTKA